jgi:hypothetical protein
MRNGLECSMTRTIRTVAQTLAIVIGTGSLGHAMELEPGTWKEIETGTEDGKPVAASTNTTCMTPDEAKDPLKGLSPERYLSELRGHCKTHDVKVTDKSLAMRVECGDPQKLQIRFTVDYTFNSPRSYSGTVKSAVTISGKSTTTDKKVEGRWTSGICVRRRGAPERG